MSAAWMESQLCNAQHCHEKGKEKTQRQTGSWQDLLVLHAECLHLFPPQPTWQSFSVSSFGCLFWAQVKSGLMCWSVWCKFHLFMPHLAVTQILPFSLLKGWVICLWTFCLQSEAKNFTESRTEMEGEHIVSLTADAELGHLFDPREFCIPNSAFICKLQFLMCHPSFGGCLQNTKWSPILLSHSQKWGSLQK